MSSLPSAKERAIPPPLGYHVPTARAQFGGRVRALREHHRYYRKSLAKLAGVSEHMIRRIEVGGAMPRFPVVLELANIFRVSINYLVSDADEAYPIYDPMTNFTDGRSRWR